MIYYYQIHCHISSKNHPVTNRKNIRNRQISLGIRYTLSEAREIHREDHRRSSALLADAVQIAQERPRKNCHGVH